MFGGTGLFGQTPATTAAQPGSLFGAQPGAGQTSLFGSQPQTQPGTGLFGSTQPQQAQQQPGAGLFGAVPGQQQQQPVTGQTSGGFGTSLFGTTPNVNAPASGGLFGQPGGGGGLFGSTQPSAPPGGTSLFGAPTGQQQQQQQPSLFSSTQQQQPQLGQQQSSLFGSTQPTQTGQQQQQQPTSLFGSTQPQQPQLGQQQPTSLFGSTQPQTQPGQQQPTSLFGSTQPQTQAGQQQPTSLFGTTQPQQQQQQQGQQQQPGTGLFRSNIGTVPPATSAPPSFSFGTTLGAPVTTTMPAAAPAAGGFTFNAPTVSSTTTTTSTIATPAPAATGGFSFGLPAAPKTTTITGTTAPGTGLTFGTAPSAPTTTSTMPTLGGSLFGSPAVTSTVTTSAAPFSFGTKLGAPSTTSTLPASTMGTTSTFSFGGIPASTASTIAPTPSTGLGGIPKYASTGAETTFAFGGGNNDGKAENRALKELPLPQEMLLLVDELKNQLKSNKLKFTELTRASNETIISKVTEEIEEVRGSVTVIANLIHKQSSNCEAIRKLIQEGISNAEMANMTRETPISSQADYTTPIQYFFRLFESFRERMNIYLREIEKAENSLSSVLSVQSAFTAKELFNALKGTRDSVIVLSAKVQILHEEVIREIEAHRNLQRYLLGETKEFSLSSSDIRQSGFMKPFSSGLDKQEGNNNYSKIGLLFPHKLVDPPKIQILNMTQNLSNTGKTTTPPAKTSTPFFSRIPGALQRPSKSSDSLFYPSNSLFQTQQSTILSPSQLPSSSPVSGVSLKRTKH